MSQQWHRALQTWASLAVSVSQETGCKGVAWDLSQGHSAGPMAKLGPLKGIVYSQRPGSLFWDPQVCVYMCVGGGNERGPASLPLPQILRSNSSHPTPDPVACWPSEGPRPWDSLASRLSRGPWRLLPAAPGLWPASLPVSASSMCLVRPSVTAAQAGGH